MSRLQHRSDALQITHEDSRSAIAGPEYIRRPATRSRLAFLLGMVTLVLPIAGYPESLDDAVESQLEIINFVPCAELRDGQPNPDTYLNEPLLTICKRGGGSSGVTPSASTGGGSATPTSLPSVVQQRLREARGEEEKPIKTVSAASADAAIEGGKRWGSFIAVEHESLDRDVTAFEDGYDSNIKRLTLGVDFQPTARWVAGLAFDAAEQDGDFDGGGDFEVKSYGLVGFGAFLPADNIFVQFYGSYARDSYKRNRTGLFSDLDSDGNILDPPTASGVQHGDYDADRYTAGILSGYDFPVRNVTISPFIGMDWKRINFDTYSESGSTGLELTFHDDEQKSLQSSVGVQALVALRSGSWVVVPQASINWKHEFENDQRDVEVSFVGDTRAKRFTYQTADPDLNWGEINVGFTAVSPGGLEVFGYYRTLVEHEFFDSDAVTIGLRVPL